MGRSMSSLVGTATTLPAKLARLHLVAGDVDLAAVDGEVAVADELTRLGAAHREAQTVNDVVQTALEDGEQVLTGLALTALGHLKVAAELALEHAVEALGLLLLAKLLAVLGVLAAALAVLAGGESAVVHRALVGVAAVALEEELLTFSAALTANCIGISSHFQLPPY